MYNVHIEVESLVYIYVYVGSRTMFFPVSSPSTMKSTMLFEIHFFTILIYIELNTTTLIVLATH